MQVSHSHKFVFQLPSADSARTLAQVPGIGIDVGRDENFFASAPINCAWLVNALCTDARLVAVPRGVKSTLQLVNPANALRELIDGVAPSKWFTKYQSEAVKKGNELRGVFIRHSPGSGKTATSILWSLCFPGRTLIVTRAINRLSFMQEIERLSHKSVLVAWPSGGVPKFIHERLRETAMGEGVVRELKAFGYLEQHVTAPRAITEAYNRWMWDQGSKSYDYIICGWEQLPYLEKSISHYAPQQIIWDEIHKAKSRKRFERIPLPDGRSYEFKKLPNITATASSITRLRSVLRRMGTTATPIKDRIKDLWAQLDLLEPGDWGRWLQLDDNAPPRGFSVRYCEAHHGEYGWRFEGVSNEVELFKRVNMISHIVPHSITHGQLPPMRREFVVVPVGELKREMGVEISVNDSSPLSNHNSSIVSNRLAIAAARKLTPITERVLEDLAAGMKVIVFTERKSNIDELYEKINKGVRGEMKGGVRTPGIPALVLRATGDDSTGARDAIRESYMKSTCAVLIATGASMGESINLQDTDRLHFAMLPMTPGEIEQREGRADRLGRLRSLLITYWIAERTIDEHVKSLLLDKLAPVERWSGSTSLGGLSETLMGGRTESVIVDSLIEMLRSGESDSEQATKIRDGELQ